MSSGHWHQVEALFADVSSLPPEQREAVLAHARRTAPDVAAEVESLLASVPADQFLASPWAVSAPPPDPEPALTGRRIGAFRLIEPIGTGGMGVVYRARREEAGYDQQVAIKIVTAAGWPGLSRRRFETERQLLASLRHPHIVTLIDAGTTEDGLAYLVMEHVDGQPITAFCRTRGLTLEARLELFRQLCAAVQHAHRHAVVHRDLKPANVLVTDDGIPKVLDFGIARLLDDPSASGGDATARGLLALTPNYASPEHIRGLPATTVDDVYALGILLYELLAGRTPYRTEGRPLDEVLRIVTDQAPPRPSRVATEAHGGVNGTWLRGNLDAIVLKAIDKDPARRYGSAQELADDLARHLRGAVVVAREPSAAYVLATLARRHRAMVAATVVSLIAILGGLGVSLLQTRRATEARDRADRRFQEVRRLANTLIFDIHDAVQPLAGSTPVRQRIVAEALTYLEQLEREADDPALRLELGRAYHRVGTVQGNPTGPNLGDRDGAIASYRRAAALLEQATTASDDAALELTRVHFSLIAVLNATGRTAEAADTAREAETAALRLLARQPRHDEARRQLGSAYFWRATLAPTGERPGESIPLWRQSGEVFGALLAESPDDAGRQRNVALVAKYLGEQYRRIGNLPAAVDQHRRALALDERRAAAAPDNRQAQLDVAVDWASIGGLLREQGQLADAAASLEASLAVRRRLAADDPRDDYLQGRLAHAHALLGRVYDDLSRTADGLAELREAVRISAARPLTDLAVRVDLASYLLDSARLEHRRGRTTAACADVARATELGLDRLTVAGAERETHADLLAAIETLRASCRDADRRNQR